MWESSLSSVGSIYTQAYAAATLNGIKNVTEAGDQNWNSSWPSTHVPNPLSKSSAAPAEHEEDEANRIVEKFHHMIYLELNFTRVYHENVHTEAFRLMKNSTKLSSDKFVRAYTAMYARTNIPDECCKWRAFPL